MWPSVCTIVIMGMKTFSPLSFPVIIVFTRMQGSIYLIVSMIPFQIGGGSMFLCRRIGAPTLRRRL